MSMKINNLNIANTPVVAECGQIEKVGKSGDHFAAGSLKSKEKQALEQLQTLLLRIDESGCRLSQMPASGELNSYKAHIRQFIGEAVSQMYSLESCNSGDRHGRQKIFATIRQIDQKLAAMAEDVCSGQDCRLSIIAKHDAVRGMLVDSFT